MQRGCSWRLDANHRTSYGGGRCCAPTALRCSVRGRAAELATLTSFAALEQPRRVRSRSARCSSPPKSPPPGSTCREVHGCCCSLKTRHGGCKGAPGQAAQRLGGAEHRRACGRARSAHPQLTCRRLSERSERSERSEFGDGPRDREAQGSRRAAATAEVKRSSLPGCGFARASARMQSRRRSSAAGREQTARVHADISCVAGRARRGGAMGMSQAARRRQCVIQRRCGAPSRLHRSRRSPCRRAIRPPAA